MVGVNISKVRASLGSLHYLDDSQLETTLLRSCLALPKISYVLRACPPTHLTQAAEELDFAMRETLETITGVPMSDWSWLKASLPCSRGGLNICSTVLHAPAALIASSHSAQSLVESILGFSPGTSHHINAAVTALTATAARLNWTCLEEVDVPLRQKPLTYAIDDASYQHLLSTAPTTRSRALTFSCGLPHAGDCLNVVPSPPMGLHLQDKEFRSCLRYWLGVSLHSSSYPCPECEGIADVFGDHRVGCGGNGDRIPRHNTVQDALFCAAQSAALVPTKECCSVCCPGSHQRVLLSLLPWFPPKSAAQSAALVPTKECCSVCCPGSHQRVLLSLLPWFPPKSAAQSAALVPTKECCSVCCPGSHQRVLLSLLPWFPPKSAAQSAALVPTKECCSVCCPGSHQSVLLSLLPWFPPKSAAQSAALVPTKECCSVCCPGSHQRVLLSLLPWFPPKSAAQSAALVPTKECCSVCCPGSHQRVLLSLLPWFPPKSAAQSAALVPTKECCSVCCPGSHQRGP